MWLYPDDGVAKVPVNITATQTNGTISGAVGSGSPNATVSANLGVGGSGNLEGKVGMVVAAACVVMWFMI